MTPELWVKTYNYIEQSVAGGAQDDIDSDFATEVYDLGLDLREVVGEVWADIDDALEHFRRWDE